MSSLGLYPIGDWFGPKGAGDPLELAEAVPDALMIICKFAILLREFGSTKKDAGFDVVMDGGKPVQPRAVALGAGRGLGGCMPAPSLHRSEQSGSEFPFRTAPDSWTIRAAQHLRFLPSVAARASIT